MIDNKYLLQGCYKILSNVEKLYADAEFLYDNKKFSLAIPLFTICIEEISKGYNLSIKARKKQIITIEEWNQLKNHKYKLEFIKNFVSANINKLNKNEKKKIMKKIDPNLKITSSNMIQAKERIDKIRTDDQYLKTLREECFYIDWDSKNNVWTNIADLNDQMQSDLAYHIMHKTKFEIFNLKLGIEVCVNAIRREIKLENLPYPKYNEHRNYEDFEIMKNITILHDFNNLKYTSGGKILHEFTKSKKFNMLEQCIKTKKIASYLKISRQSDFLHPMMDAMLSALIQAVYGVNNRHYVGKSDDSVVTSNALPILKSIVTAIKQKDITSPAFIKIICDNKSNTFTFNDRLIELLIESEIVIERESGNTISIPTMHEAFSKIGIKVHILSNDEINIAIKITKKHADILPKNICEQIKDISYSNWDNLLPDIKNIIITFFQTEHPTSKNEIILSGSNSMMDKSKIRTIIYLKLLELKNFQRL